MIIGISGAQGVGKTTLLNSLREVKELNGYAFRDEATRWVKELNVDINEMGNDLTQELIMMKHLYNLKIYNHKMISDRTVLDCLVYTRYLYDIDQVSKECLDEIEVAFHATKNDYNMTFYIEPEVALEDDGVRSTSLEFRKRIIELFEYAIFEDLDDKVIRVRGSVEARTKQITDRILYSI